MYKASIFFTNAIMNSTVYWVLTFINGPQISLIESTKVKVVYIMRKKRTYIIFLYVVVYFYFYVVIFLTILGGITCRNFFWSLCLIFLSCVPRGLTWFIYEAKSHRSLDIIYRNIYDERQEASWQFSKKKNYAKRLLI